MDALVTVYSDAQGKERAKERAKEQQKARVARVDIRVATKDTKELPLLRSKTETETEKEILKARVTAKEQAKQRERTKMGMGTMGTMK